MSQLHEYGELVHVTPYCEKISIEEIEYRAGKALEDFKSPDKVYLSNDLYASLLKQMADKYQPYGYVPGTHVSMINTCAGPLTVVPVPGMVNFCLVGTEADYNLVERAKIDKAFEEIVFGGKDITDR